MKLIIKKILLAFIPIGEILYLPLLIASGLVMFLYRRIGSQRLKLSTQILRRIGVFPIRDHYYEPLFNDAHLLKNLSEPRNLPGINFNEDSQIKLLGKLNYQTEFTNFVESEKNKLDESAFKIANGSFESGDAEFLFNIKII